MAKRPNNRLARLIRERSYLSGEIVRGHDLVMALTAQIGELRERVLAAREDIAHKEARKADLDALIQQGSAAIDPADINTVKKTHRRTSGPRGDLIQAVVENLMSSPDGITTLDLAERLAPQFGMPWAAANERYQTVERVRRMLNKLKVKGAVQRLDGARSPNNQKVARWKWVGD